MHARCGFGLALLCTAVAVGGRTHAQAAPPCGAQLAAGTAVSWRGTIEDGYVQRSAEGKPQFIFVLACADPGAGPARFALRLEDVTVLPPVGGLLTDRAARSAPVLAVTAAALAADTVRGVGGARVAFVAPSSARYAAASDSVAAAEIVARKQPHSAPPADVLLIIDGVPIGPAGNPILAQRFEWLSIDSIEVLRGPNAIARYGADARGGAIIVGTRRTRP